MGHGDDKTGENLGKLLLTPSLTIRFRHGGQGDLIGHSVGNGTVGESGLGGVHLIEITAHCRLCDGEALPCKQFRQLRL